MGSIERRSRQDRRNLEIGPPGGVGERRVLAERRMPQVAVRNFSDVEWRTYFGWHEYRQAIHAVVLQDRPTNIPGRLWTDF